jgi:hypothetical protein
LKPLKFIELKIQKYIFFLLFTCGLSIAKKEILNEMSDFENISKIVMLRKIGSQNNASNCLFLIQSHRKNRSYFNRPLAPLHEWAVVVSSKPT